MGPEVGTSIRKSTVLQGPRKKRKTENVYDKRQRPLKSFFILPDRRPFVHGPFQFLKVKTCRYHGTSHEEISYSIKYFKDTNAQRGSDLNPEDLHLTRTVLYPRIVHK